MHAFRTHLILVEESFCKGKQDGTYSDPDQCTTYYQCTSGYAVRRHCPTGQVFNDILKACDSPADFPCHQRTVVNTPSPTLAREKDKGGSSQKSELISILFAVLLFNFFTYNTKICCCSSDISLLNGFNQRVLLTEFSTFSALLISVFTLDSGKPCEARGSVGHRRTQCTESGRIYVFARY